MDELQQAVERPDLTGRIGGPVGRHGVRRGPWFNPAVWAFATAGLLWVLTVWRQKPCQQHTPQNPINGFLRLCYSDIPVAYQNTALGRGGSALDLAQNWAPLTALLVDGCRWVARLFGARSVAGASAQDIVNGAYVFFLVAALALFGCFLVLVACSLLTGHDSARLMGNTTTSRVRSWDALLVAAAPVVFTSGLVSWDLFAVALTAAAVLAWSLDRRLLCGLLFGLAITAGAWPVLVLLALALVCQRAGRLDAFGPVAGTAAGVTALVSVLLWIGHPNPWGGMVGTWLRRGADLGSVWFVLDQLHLKIPAAVLSVAVATLFVAWVGWVVLLVLQVSPRRPRLGQVAFLLVAGWLLLNKGYVPQQVLWLVPLVVLARPRLADWALWISAEVAYWAAVWGHLGNMLTPGDGSPDVIYWAATLFRVIVLAWLCGQVAHDIRHPRQDPVRSALVDDPIGGVLDHAVAPVPRGVLAGATALIDD